MIWARIEQISGEKSENNFNWISMYNLNIHYNYYFSIIVWLFI